MNKTKSEFTISYKYNNGNQSGKPVTGEIYLTINYVGKTFTINDQNNEDFAFKNCNCLSYEVNKLGAITRAINFVIEELNLDANDFKIK